jgi:hypothetical protein
MLFYVEKSKWNHAFVQEAMRQSLDNSKKEEDLEALELEKAIRLSLQEQGLTQDKECSLQLVRASVML